MQPFCLQVELQLSLLTSSRTMRLRIGTQRARRAQVAAPDYHHFYLRHFFLICRVSSASSNVVMVRHRRHRTPPSPTRAAAHERCRRSLKKSDRQTWPTMMIKPYFCINLTFLQGFLLPVCAAHQRYVCHEEKSSSATLGFIPQCVGPILQLPELVG